MARWLLSTVALLLYLTIRGRFVSAELLVLNSLQRRLSRNRSKNFWWKKQINEGGGGGSEQKLDNLEPTR